MVSLFKASKINENPCHDKFEIINHLRQNLTDLLLCRVIGLPLIILITTKLHISLKTNKMMSI